MTAGSNAHRSSKASRLVHGHSIGARCQAAISCAAAIQRLAVECRRLPRRGTQATISSGHCASPHRPGECHGRSFGGLSGNLREATPHGVLRRNLRLLFGNSKQQLDAVRRACLPGFLETAPTRCRRRACACGHQFPRSGTASVPPGGSESVPTLTLFSVASHRCSHWGKQRRPINSRNHARSG
jgi:hypothetical protein